MDDYHRINNHIIKLLNNNNYEEAREYLKLPENKNNFTNNILEKVELYYIRDILSPQFKKAHKIYMNSPCMHGFNTKYICNKCNCNYKCD